MKICFLTLRDPEDKTSWSGIFHHMYINLEKYHRVEWIGKIKFKLWQKIFLKSTRISHKLMKNKIWIPSILFCKFYAENVKKKIEVGKYDIIYAPVSSTLIAFLDTNIPIVYLSDATFHLMVDYYPEFTGLSKTNIKDGNKIDRMAFQRTEKIIFSSNWAKNDATQYYKVPAEKISVFEFGANLLYEPNLNDLDFSESEICNILFLGVDWIRKGGETAYKTYLELKKKGFRCTFTIIGCNPNINTEDSNITIIPFINKNDRNEFDKLYKIFLQTQILLLPSKAECFGIVFSEASAFGIPSITTNTGGISNAIEDGINGYLLDVHADENAFADKIYSLFSNKETFKQLRMSSRKAYDTKLSWKVWGENFNQCINNLI